MSERTNDRDREVKSHGHTASMHVSEESDRVRVSLWLEAWRKKVAQRDVVVVRYADDGVVGFEYREDAERFLVDL
jgi:hypothetical protein